MGIDYDKFVNLDNVTIQDCLDLFYYKNKRVVIEDGRIVDFVKEK